MKRKLKHTSKLYEFLDKTGALSGSDDQIKAAKAEYRKRYKAEWRRQKRKETQEVTVILNHKELQVISQAAKRHRMSKPKFLKQAAIGYLNHTYVVPDVLTINTIQEYLILTYSEVQHLFDEDKLLYETGKELMRKISALEVTVLDALRQPERMEDRIAAELKKNPALAQTLKELLKNYEL